MGANPRKKVASISFESVIDLKTIKVGTCCKAL